MPTLSKKETKALLSSSAKGSERTFVWSAVMSQSRPMSLGTCCRTGPSFTVAPGDSNKPNTMLQHLEIANAFFFFLKFKMSRASVVTEVITSLLVKLPQSCCAEHKRRQCILSHCLLMFPLPLRGAAQVCLQVAVRYGTEGNVAQNKQLNFQERVQWKQDTESLKAFMSIFLMKNKQNIKYIP